MEAVDNISHCPTPFFLSLSHTHTHTHTPAHEFLKQQSIAGNTWHLILLAHMIYKLYNIKL